MTLLHQARYGLVHALLSSIIQETSFVQVARRNIREHAKCSLRQTEKAVIKRERQGALRV